jgi:hypothetical protein
MSGYTPEMIRGLDKKTIAHVNDRWRKVVESLPPVSDKDAEDAFVSGFVAPHQARKPFDRDAWFAELNAESERLSGDRA